MKLFKRCIVMLLSLAIMITFMPVMAYAEGEAAPEGSTEESVALEASAEIKQIIEGIAKSEDLEKTEESAVVTTDGAVRSAAKSADDEKEEGYGVVYVAGYPVVLEDNDYYDYVNPSLPKGISYNLSTNTLTLNNYSATIEDEIGITSYLDELNILLKGTNTITTNANGIDANELTRGCRDKQ